MMPARTIVSIPRSTDIAASPALGPIAALETALALTLAALRAEHAPLTEFDHDDYHRPALERHALHLMAKASALQRTVSEYREAISDDLATAFYGRNDDLPF
jgi:hypothetical protein